MKSLQWGFVLFVMEVAHGGLELGLRRPYYFLPPE